MAAGRSRGSAAATPVSSPARPPRRRSWSPSPTGAARAPSPSSRTAQRGPKTSGAEPLREHLLAELAALAALRLGLAEQRRQLVVAIAFRVLDVLLEAQRVRQRLLGEPDQVVVLVLRARYLAGPLGAAHAALLSLGLSRSLPSAGTGNARLAGRRRYRVRRRLRPMPNHSVPKNAAASAVTIAPAIQPKRWPLRSPRIPVMANIRHAIPEIAMRFAVATR